MKQLQLFYGLWLTGAVVAIAAQPAWAQQVTQITAVRLNQTPSGLEVILDTANGVKPQVFTSSSKQTFVADIANAQLRLPQGNEFRANNPAKGISAIAVTNFNANSVRVTVAGTARVPAVEVLESDAAGLIFSLKPAPVAAAEEEINVVVTATRTEEEVEDLPRAVTVITREEIELQTTLSRDLVDILGQLTPGLGPPTQTDSNFGQSIRGRDPQVLIDGVPVTSNESNNGFNRDLRSISPEAVERIEIVRGPSAIYGNGATGGVINIVTRRPGEQRLTSQTEVGVDAADNLEAGSFGYFFSHSISGTEGDFDYFALFSRNDTGIFFDAEGDPIPFLDEGTAETETIQAFTKVGVDFDQNQRLQLTVNFTRDHYDPTIGNDLSINDLSFRRKARAIDYPEQEYIGLEEPETENTTLSLNYSHENLFGSQLQAQVYYRDTEINTVPLDLRSFDETLGVFAVNSEDDQWGGRLQIDTPLFGVASVLWGVDYSNANLSSTENLIDTQEFDITGGRIARKIGEFVAFPLYEVENLGLFAQFQWDVSEQWLLSSGVRYEQIGVSTADFINSEGENITGGDIDVDDVVFNAGAVFRATDELSLYASFAQGFSIPAISRILGNAREGFNFGTDVDISSPQKVDNYEIGVKSEWQNVQVSLAAFYNESELGTTLIRANPDDLNLTLVRAPQRNYGVEAAVDWQLGEDWQLGGTVTWVEGENDIDEDGDFEALRSPEVSPIKLTAYVEHQTTPGWRNRLQALYVGSRDRAFEAGVDLVPINSYFVLDYIGSIQLGPGNLQIGIGNLLNNQYFTVVNQWEGGFDNYLYRPARGRSISLGYQITW